MKRKRSGSNPEVTKKLKKKHVFDSPPAESLDSVVSIDKSIIESINAVTASTGKTNIQQIIATLKENYDLASSEGIADCYNAFKSRVHNEYGLNRTFAQHFEKQKLTANIGFGQELAEYNAPQLANIIFGNVFYQYLHDYNIHDGKYRIDFNAQLEGDTQDRIEWKNRRFDALSRLIALDSQCLSCLPDRKSSSNCL